MYNGSTPALIELLPLTRKITPPPGTPVFDEICTPGAFPCNSWSNPEAAVSFIPSERLMEVIAPLTDLHCCDV